MTGNVLTYWRLNATDMSDIHVEIILLVLVIRMSSKVSRRSEVKVSCEEVTRNIWAVVSENVWKYPLQVLNLPPERIHVVGSLRGKFNKTVKPGRKEVRLRLCIPFSIQNSPGSTTLPAKDLWVNYAKSEDVFLPNLELTLWNFHVISAWPQGKHYC